MATHDSNEKLLFIVTVDAQYYSTSTEHPSGRPPSKADNTRAAELFQMDLADMLVSEGKPADTIEISNDPKDTGLIALRCTAAVATAIEAMPGQKGVRRIQL